MLYTLKTCLHSQTSYILGKNSNAYVEIQMKFLVILLPKFYFIKKLFLVKLNYFLFTMGAQQFAKGQCVESQFANKKWNFQQIAQKTHNLPKTLQQEERHRPLSQGSLSARFARKPLLVRLFSTVCHCGECRQRCQSVVKMTFWQIAHVINFWLIVSQQNNQFSKIVQSVEISI